jgi:hypothetical protein
MRMRFHDRPMPMWSDSISRDTVPPTKDLSKLTLQQLEELVSGSARQSLADANRQEYEQIRKMNERNRQFWNRGGK